MDTPASNLVNNSPTGGLGATIYGAAIANALRLHLK